MSSLSQWDMEYLSPDEQKKALNLKSQWGSDPKANASLHASLEQIRASKGYSGGSDGSQYIPIEQFNAPVVPEIPQYESPYGDQINDLFEQIKNPPQYESPYSDLLNQQISDLMNRPKFDYDPESDKAYQAFKQRALRAGDKAYDDNLGGLAAMTGGRANSWAGSVASQARNEFVMQAEEAVVHFEDRAYSRYRDETADMYNLTNLLQSQDEVAYSRFRDTIGDTKDLADMVLKLDDRGFEQYKFMADNQWKTFETEYNAYKDSLQFKKDKISEALDRTNLNGYVNNKDSIVLGVPTGTLSQTARERAENMEDYIKKSEIDLENQFKDYEERHKYDLKLIDAKEASELKTISARARASNRGSSNTDSGDRPVQVTAADGNKRDKAVNEYNETVSSKDFQRLTDEEKRSYISNYIDKLLNDYNDGVFGKNGDWIVNETLGEIRSSGAYIEYIEKYETGQSYATYYDQIKASNYTPAKNTNKDRYLVPGATGGGVR